MWRGRWKCSIIIRYLDKLEVDKACMHGIVRGCLFSGMDMGGNTGEYRERRPEDEGAFPQSFVAR